MLKNITTTILIIHSIMEQINIHNQIVEKLDGFLKANKIPNILFHGQYGCGKKTIIMDFVNKIYSNNITDDLVLFVNCSHGKGIKFIREDLKFFAKTNVVANNYNIKFKTVILSNADKLTMDAQSALRRCIELFSHNTRFFIVAEDKYKLMKPILSRFCELYVPEPVYNNEIININKYILNKTFKNASWKKDRDKWLQHKLKQISNISTLTIKQLTEKSAFFYEKGYSSIDVFDSIKLSQLLANKSNTLVEIYLCLSKMRREIRNEKILILMVLNLVFLNGNINIQNISFL